MRGDVPDDSSEVPRLTQVEHADGQVHREGGAVFAATDHFPSDANDFGLPALDIVGDVTVVLAAVGLRHQHLDVLADDLLRGVAEYPFGCWIEGRDRAAVVMLMIPSTT